MFNTARKHSRLGQWDGRSRSSRSEEPLLTRMRRGPALLRLLTIMLTVLAVTALALWWGPPLPYRIGQICASDVRVRAYFEVVNEALTEQAREDAVKSLSPAQAADPGVREEARQTVAPVVDRYPVGTLLVPRGQPITEAQRALLRQEFRAYLRSLTPADNVRRTAAL